jgi:hypothetical protein
MSVFGKLPFANELRTGISFLGAFKLGWEQIFVLYSYLTGKLFPDHGDEVHLRETMNWLVRAQEVCAGQGVSNLFTLKTGWGVAYPETSGYIVATYYAYADFSKDSSYIERAVQIGDWEIAIQADNGGVLSSTETPQTRVFNTGQVILGWCLLYERTGEEKYLQAAIRAGDFLVRGQEEDGAWRQNTYCGARTYHARVDWALLRLAQLTRNELYMSTAIRNIKWVLAQQQQNGWFAQCGFDEAHPVMHVIVYTLRGLLECSQIDFKSVEELCILSSVIKSANALCEALQANPVDGITGMVPTAFDENWKTEAKDSCLTGNAQLSIFLYRLTQCTGNLKYRKVADTVMNATKRTQLVETSLMPIKGAIAGSFPISRGYIPNAYPNWAAKFHADALMMKMHTDGNFIIWA